jgi:RIO kinase 1
MFDAIIRTILIFWEAGIVHADLSEYNILWWKNEVYIIDFPQSTDRKTNPNSQMFLERDLKNLIRFFERYIEIDHEKIFKIFNDGTQSYTI